MEIGEFCRKVEAHPRMRLLGIGSCENREPLVYIVYRPRGRAAERYALSAGAIRNCDWIELEALVSRPRRPTALSGVRRIIDYDEGVCIRGIDALASPERATR